MTYTEIEATLKQDKYKDLKDITIYLCGKDDYKLVIGNIHENQDVKNLFMDELKCIIV
jgi:hypothetical protein